MAKSISTAYYSQATAKCLNCGSLYTLGMTKESVTLEICGNCHPFYTGKEVMVDTAGRIDKFMKRAEAGKAKTSQVAKKVKSRKLRQIMEIMEEEAPAPKTQKSASSATRVKQVESVETISTAQVEEMI